MKDPIILEIGNNPTHAVIWLHGLGANGHDFETIVPQLYLPENVSVRFIFPNAPDRPVTINGRMLMPAWYDIKGLNIESKQDLTGMQESFRLVERLISEQIAAGIEADKIVLAGFSQGGAVVLYTMLRSDYSIAGVMALSSYLPFLEASADEQNSNNLKTPVFMGHGTMDLIVPYELGIKSRNSLHELGYQTNWYEYPMQHTVTLEEIIDISSWLRALIEKAE